MQGLTQNEVRRPQRTGFASVTFSLAVSVAYLIAAGAVGDVSEEKGPKLGVSTLQISGRHTSLTGWQLRAIFTQRLVAPS